MAQVAQGGKRRHIRHGRFDRLRTNAAGTPRSEAFYDFLSREGTRLDSSATGETFVAVNATNRLTVTTHPFVDADGPYLLTTSGTLPDGLDGVTSYWVSVIDANTIQLYTGRRENLTVGAAEFADDGTGTHTMTKATDEEGIFHVNRANRPETIEAATDIDALA